MCGVLLYHTPDVNLMPLISKCLFSARFTFSNIKHLAHKSRPSVSTSFVFLDVWEESLQVSPELGTVATWP